MTSRNTKNKAAVSSDAGIRAGSLPIFSAEEALSESEERLRAILETAVEGILTIDDRGVVESVNRAGERIFGYPAAEIIGRNVSVLMPSPYREHHDSYLAAYLRTGQAKIIGIGREVVGQRKDGSTFPMDLSVSEVRLSNRRLFTGFVRDLSERKRLEAEVLAISDREQRRIGQDLHDGLGQHLAGIELMSEVLEQRLAGARSKEAGQLAPEAAKISFHVREAISQARALARGLSPVVVESEGLMAALQQLADSASRMFRIQCEFDCAPPVLVTDHAVATHLYRIAQEAVSNAVKHGKTKVAQIRLRASGERIVLVIRDKGTGIPDQLPPGKGMGLRIMQYRAGIIGGSVVIQRHPEGGTSVTCSVHKTTLKPAKTT